MTKLTKLIDKTESKVKVICPVTDTELRQREADFPNLAFIDFAKKYRKQLYTDVTIVIDGTVHKIQANTCINPFCRWYGLPQHTYKDLRYRPSRYGLWGSHPTNSMKCMPVNVAEPQGVTIDNDYVSPMSNWSLAEEIKRVIDINTITTVNENYQFHRENCIESSTTPTTHPSQFSKRGKSSSNSQKLQCKTCGKMTNILPTVRECFTYRQKKNDILPSLMLQIVNRAPVTRSMEQLRIGSSTYYNKLEWLHRRCLEFLERHETKPLQKMHFDELWLNTDKFIYFLNNIRKKGHALDYETQERLMLATHIIATTDAYSRYTFRTDIAYDFTVKAEDIEKDIETYKEEKLNSFVQKSARYRHSYYGDRRRKSEDFIDDVDDDILERTYLDLRKDYVDGLHINSTYTAFAQYWLIKKMLNVDRMNIICDDDRTLINSIMRVFREEIKSGKYNVFTCQVEKEFTKKEAYRSYLSMREELDLFIEKYGLKGTRTEAATLMLAEDLLHISVYEMGTSNGQNYFYPNPNCTIQHPMPFQDEGIRYINVLTDLSMLSNLELAEQLINVNMRAINTYFNQLRRRCSLLERPLVTARGEGKSYIYSNFNPKYAHYLLTIARTYLNFCDTYKYHGKEVTPAMRLGLADKVYTVEDIIYFK
jgi:hypothetical protein